MAKMSRIMANMYTRSALCPNHSFFLFGPRGTGKTTWLRQSIEASLWVNLLLDSEYVSMISDPGLFRRQVLSHSNGGWVVVDEVQRVPGILNEVHDLISLYGDKYKFALSGSSARKLRRMEANLLAGRVLDLKFFPLTSREMSSDFDLVRTLSIGALPGVVTDQTYCHQILDSYVSTYLREEIQQEALVHSLDSFARFLRVAALMNGCQLSTSSLSRDCGVARKTVERYFQTLVDTLIAFQLPAWQPKVKVREVKRPKFYFFDCGVVRALTGRHRQQLHDLEIGLLLETFIISELRAANMYQGVGAEFSYYADKGKESDVIVSCGTTSLGIEIKSSSSWRKEDGKGLNQLLRENRIKRGIGVFRGTKMLRESLVEVYPVEDFLRLLWNGELFGLLKE